MERKPVQHPTSPVKKLCRSGCFIGSCSAAIIQTTFLKDNTGMMQMALALFSFIQNVDV